MPEATMLIVDDSKLSRMMVRAIVKQVQGDWNIIEAENGEDALVKSEAETVDIMTLDYNMPGMDGLTLAEHMRQRFPDASIALLTANIQDTIRLRAESAGVGFIQKPITEDKIAEFVDVHNGTH
ncbi:MAG: response regulator receiver protein [Gammaproteobacteria bacterium (ex Lamellibrachia satsuma)]|nr:MAG: response regulator [Gammaproteobacteria bacterium (ex Lamellibrachia satsuma)]RRS33974.1 MAG: response regulator receiver protein [Gammaproteobacteria bacterium (ex Lamellibrachia satsuma)]RRS35590.1 MAG: response regulator receiver protein [Gammaproteobacteria bacterium (ex Lamellibrachia satsuma)]